MSVSPLMKIFCWNTRFNKWPFVHVIKKKKKAYLSTLSCSIVLQGSCVNAPMIVVADYSNGVEGYSYNYYVSFPTSDT